ncbi:helicase domain-containing protein [Anaerobium acetethylicum]|uniref:RNA helicase n=1 Tax=Anaerobium acetethylicum TaxID=1619234 RepID=A0A1D3TUP2_9FIRM|nr:hypothetical protein [Anaerobium acetethylicum]SCP97795.1 RNA helicase [Anaerobium acetethylicum]
MSVITQNKLFVEEERYKEEVYRTFDGMASSASSEVRLKKASITRGSFDDKEAFMMQGQLSGAEKRRREIEQLVGKLYDRPYFSHVEVSMEDDEYDREHYFLSDCESLNEMVPVGKDGYVLPFKQDRERPISGALFHCYQSKKGSSISYRGPQGDEFVFVPQSICDTDIKKRKLLNVIQLYPTPDVSQNSADELLESKLKENRDNPTLRNIISTLQQMQFEIIKTDTKTNFVVQGCAGSGKSQCLLHRLFFLRDELSQDGWNGVLLLTPTKLFRQYSAELVRRYQLSDIDDCSIADLYITLLNAYDVRFKDRQYKYQLTEEYLPNGYLFAVYEEENVVKIEHEIDNALRKYVQAGCKALGIEEPAEITALVVEDIVKQLDEEMKAFDIREEALQQNDEYQEKRKEYEQLLKDVETNKKKKQRYTDEIESIAARRRELDLLVETVNEVEKEKADWVHQREKRVKDAVKKLEEVSRKFERGTDLQAPAKYAQQLFIVKNLTEGRKFLEDEEYLVFLDEYISQAKAELQEFTKDKKVKNIIDRYAKREQEVNGNLESISGEIEEMLTRIEEYSEWLREAASNFEGEEARITLLRSEMERARYFLVRLESTVFEQEVWNALSPVKEQYGIQKIQVEELKDGKHKESRILYKSDLLFYIRIYMKLHPDANLPGYSLICIDEGQDLHRADYDILHGLYPKAVFNVFGDVNQVLHATCGIREWERQTGISTVYPLTTNYRNTAAIVEFCNEHFDTQMEYVGGVDKKQRPIVVTDIDNSWDRIASEDLVVIVKDRESYEEFCKDAGIETDSFVYLDTTSVKSTEKQKECYSIFAAKGLEFSNVFVYAKHMTKNQKVVACTRAMGGLYYYE